MPPTLFMGQSVDSAWDDGGAVQNFVERDVRTFTNRRNSGNGAHTAGSLDCRDECPGGFDRR